MKDVVESKQEKYTINGMVMRKGAHFPAKGNFPEVSLYNVQVLIPGDVIDGSVQYEKQVWDVIEKTSNMPPAEGTMVSVRGVPKMRASLSKKNGKWYHSLALYV